MKIPSKKPEIIVIAHNIRSTYNVGSIFRTCEGFGVKQIILSGYTPYPLVENDSRLPHIATKLTKEIHKTALGAEDLVYNIHQDEPDFDSLRSKGFTIVGLEQSETAVLLPDYKAPEKIALLIGEEVHGISQEFQELCDELVEIPMQGEKESFNVSVAIGIALYSFTN